MEGEREKGFGLLVREKCELLHAEDKTDHEKKIKRRKEREKVKLDLKEIHNREREEVEITC